MKTQHTPGPWEWDGNVWQYDKSQESPWLVQAPWSDSSSKTVLSGSIKCSSEADARLIAAAPDLLAFAQEWLTCQGTDKNYMTEKARAAIAKAERGES